jgi:hypothetical protein
VQAFSALWASHGEAVLSVLAFVGTMLFNLAVTRAGGFTPFVASLEALPVVGPAVLALRHLGPDPVGLAVALNQRANRVATARVAPYGLPPPPFAPAPPAPPGEPPRDLSGDELERVLRRLPTREQIERDDLSTAKTLNVSPPGTHVRTAEATEVESVEAIAERFARSRP